MSGQWYTLGLDISGFGSGIRSAAGMLGSFGLAVDGVQKAIGMAKVAIEALSKPVQLAAEFESTKLAIQTIVGDLGSANALMAQIEKHADATSFEFPELASAAKMLLAMGTNAGDVTDELKMMGDLAAGLNQPIESFALVWGQARASVQLMGGDMMQLTSKGVGAYKEIAEVLQLSVAETKKLGETGQLTFPLLQEAFRRLTSEGGKFHQMTQKQAGTTLGLWSTMTDGVNRLYRQMGAPINDMLRPMMKEVNEKYLPDLSSKFALTIATMQQAVAGGKFGQLLQDSAIYGLAKAGNFAEGLFDWLPKLLGKGLESVANTFNGTFSTNGQDVVKNFGMGMLKALQAAGDFIWAALGEPFRVITAAYSAGMELAINNALDALGRLDPSLRRTYGQLFDEAYEAASPENRSSDGKDHLEEAGEEFKKGLVSLFKVAKDVHAQGGMPEFKQSTTFDKEARVSLDRLSRAGKEGQVQIDATKKANEEAAQKLDKTKTSAEDLAKALDKAKESAKGAADSEKGKGSGEKYKSLREQRAEALADRRARIDARSSKGYSYTDQFKPQGSSLDYLKGKGLTGMGAPAQESSLSYLNGKGLSGIGSREMTRSVNRRGAAVAAGIAQEGAQNKAADKANKAQAANADAGSVLERIERGITALASTVQGMQKSFESKLGVA